MTAAPDTEPPDDALLELGRVVWAAIYLEDVTYTICRWVKPPGDTGPIGDVISRVRKFLSTHEDVDLASRLDAWLAASAAALEERNTILHATPMTFVQLRGTEPIPGVPPHALTDVPRRPDRPIVNTSISRDALRPIRRRIEQAVVGWTDLLVEWDEAHPGGS